MSAMCSASQSRTPCRCLSRRTSACCRGTWRTGRQSAGRRSSSRLAGPPSWWTYASCMPPLLFGPLTAALWHHVQLLGAARVHMCSRLSCPARAARSVPAAPPAAAGVDALSAHTPAGSPAWLGRALKHGSVTSSSQATGCAAPCRDREGRELPHDGQAFGELQTRGGHAVQQYHKVPALLTFPPQGRPCVTSVVQSIGPGSGLLGGPRSST